PTRHAANVAFSGRSAAKSRAGASRSGSRLVDATAAFARLPIDGWLYDNCAGEFVVPALLASIQTDPENPEQQRDSRQVIPNIAHQQLSGRGFTTGCGIQNDQLQYHLSGRRRF